ncbi:MAG TPA: cytochrome b [Sphingobium sp.]|uniref:cytochrome b n=1 Tax=Sphingobium sp. TaxID=1912891 RepID=UPI002ED2E913
MKVQRYTGTAMALHWIIALLIIFAVGLNWAWDGGVIPDAKVRYAIDWHKSIGILVLGLAILRLLWRFGHTPPRLPTKFQRWEIRLSGVTHGLLYLVMFAMPLSGWIMDSAWKDAATHPMHFMGSAFEWPRLGFIMDLAPATKNSIHSIFGAMHGLVAKLLYALFVLHVGAALKHQFLDRERELQRMWPGK